MYKTSLNKERAMQEIKHGHSVVEFITLRKLLWYQKQNKENVVNFCTHTKLTHTVSCIHIKLHIIKLQKWILELYTLLMLCV